MLATNIVLKWLKNITLVYLVSPSEKARGIDVRVCVVFIVWHLDVVPHAVVNGRHTGGLNFLRATTSPDTSNSKSTMWIIKYTISFVVVAYSFGEETNDPHPHEKLQPTFLSSTSLFWKSLCASVWRRNNPAPPLLAAVEASPLVWPGSEKVGQISSCNLM